MDIPGTIAAVGSALSIVKEIRAIDTQIDQATLKLKIAELTSALADAKLGLVDVAQLLHEKAAQITKLTALVKYRAENLVDQNGFRYEAKDGKAFGPPYCPVCEAKGIFLKLAQNRALPGIPYVCPSCKANYGPTGIYAKDSA
ncbi:hypothetical protein LRP31_07435 [Mesorhizobium mediterraneum]|uniref:Uncharacterized protein n=1 Tax=Mesorhizobium mediterraneum TaxID=43617 RepID=A0AB36R900_9HYPH|nr:hypothetical protein [Mesorhizobium mediterraneum]PAQ00761.1 hypothetical protein CIT25_17980 [Mesorhizobium mediterraneum]WIW55057.1 hypothetical protein LRP31_07435 [Mesorhizobium mediterraneum]